LIGAAERIAPKLRTGEPEDLNPPQLKGSVSLPISGRLFFGALMEVVTVALDDELLPTRDAAIRLSSPIGIDMNKEVDAPTRQLDLTLQKQVRSGLGPFLHCIDVVVIYPRNPTEVFLIAIMQVQQQCVVKKGLDWRIPIAPHHI
jgi:hypothetical protein